ncbi:hypothetical protein K438DRAFT_1964097 [Mycena galopus ATCC 62051]|nr:hypothetical protein K438DRAFT_1964097 [Mycena galopus ATCC 62051]
MFRMKMQVKLSISRKDSCKEQSWTPKPLMLVDKFKEEAKTKPVTVSRILRALGLRKKRSKTPLTKEYVYYEDEACAGPSEPEFSPSSRPSSRIPTFLISASSARPILRPASQALRFRRRLRSTPVLPTQMPRLRPRIHTSTPTTTLSVLVSQPSALRPRFRPSTTTVTPAIVSPSSGSRLRPLVLCSVPATTSSSIPSLSPVPRAATRSRIPVYVGRHASCTNRTALCGRASPSRVSKTAVLSSVQPDAKVAERAHNSQTIASSRIMAELGTQTVFGMQTKEKLRLMADASVQTEETARIVADAAVQAHAQEPKTTDPEHRAVADSAAPHPPPPPPPPPPVKATRTRIVVSKPPPSTSSDLMTELKERFARRESLGIHLPALHGVPAPVSRSPSTLKSTVLKMRQFAKKGKENAALRQEEESELQRVFQRKATKAKSSAAGGRRLFGVVDTNTTTADIPARRNKSKTNRIAVQPLAAQAEPVPSVSSLFSSSPPPLANPLKDSTGPLPQSTSATRSSSNLKSAIQRIRQFVTKEKEDPVPQEDSELQRVFRSKGAGGRRPFRAGDTNSTAGSSPDHAPLPRRRKLRRIVVPPLAEGSVPSTNPQIQSELERLRAQGKVGGGGGVGVRVRGVGGDSKTRKSYISERTEN